MRRFNRWDGGRAGVEACNEGDRKIKSCRIVHGLIARSIGENGGGVGRERNWIDYRPICDDGHWGMVFVVKDGPGRAVTWWGIACTLFRALESWKQRRRYTKAFSGLGCSMCTVLRTE